MSELKLRPPLPHLMASNLIPNTRRSEFDRVVRADLKY